MRVRILVASSGLLAAMAALALPTAVSAHAVIPAGNFHVALGWSFEPSSGTATWVDYPNAVQVFVDTATPAGGIGTPVSDLNADCSKPDLQVTVTFGSTTSSPLCPVPVFDPDTGLGRPDEYDAAITPTRVGTYTFHITGSIHGTPIDKSVTSGPSTFDNVGDQSAVQFPTAAPALSAIASKLDALASRDTTAAGSASDAANRASILAIFAIVLAVLAGAANVAVMLRRRRT